jgi:hypothetical protein
VTGCVFKYGPNTNYTEGTMPCSPAVSGGSPITTTSAVSASLASLSPGTEYHYRVFATNANGTQAGHDGTFVTPKSIDVVTTGEASAIVKDKATVHGSYVGDGQDTHYYFQYGTSAHYGQTTPASPGTDSGSGSGEQVVSPIQLTGLLGDTTYHYRLVAVNSFGPAYGEDKTFTTDHPVTNLTADEPTNVTNVGAELNGSFDGDNYATLYYFEYGQSQNYGATIPAPPGLDAGTGPGRVTVAPVAIGGLQEAATYHFRIVATNATGTTRSPDATFRTATAPEVNSFSSTNVTSSSADLLANISTDQADTEYRFEYGPSLDYGTSVPIPDASLPGDKAEHAVVQHLDGLDSVTFHTYHFRVTAHNKYGTTTTKDQTFGFYPSSCPNEKVRQETRSNNLPDCRGYEIASASYTGGTTIVPSSGPVTGVAVSPSRLAYAGGYGRIPGTGDPTNSVGDLYVATRSVTGWHSKYIGRGGNETQEVGGPPEFGMGLLLGQEADFNQFGVQASASMDRIVNYDQGNPEAAGGSNAPYVWDSETNTLLDRWPTNLADVPGGEKFVGKPKMSADLTHLVFSSNVVFAPGGQATTAAVCGPNESQGFGAGVASIYDNDVTTGSVELISLAEDGTPFLGDPVAVSPDGSHIVMDAPAPGQSAENCTRPRYFVRINDEKTYDIAGGHDINYLGTTADGRTIYFASPDQLTPDDHDESADLFMWSEDHPNELTRVSKGNTGDAGDTDNCSEAWTTRCGVLPISFKRYSEMQGGLGGNRTSDNFIASQSGDIYFQSPEQLDGAKGEFGQVNLYYYDPAGEEVVYVATMPPEPLCTSDQNLPFCSDTPIARMQVDPNNSHAAFITPGSVTAYDSHKHGEMYTFEPSTGKLLCASCVPNGDPPKFDVYGSENGLFLTRDGRVFFSTNDALVPHDTNQLLDIYEYVAGRPQLISTGIGPAPTGFAGFSSFLSLPGLVSVSADGTDAYFATYDNLVTQDHNGLQLKIYDARTGGGFPADVPPPNCAAADECHGAGSLPPATIVHGSSPNQGKGNNYGANKKKHQKKKHQKKKHQKKKSKAGNGKNHRGARSG